jgi:hypothetical protein
MIPFAAAALAVLVLAAFPTGAAAQAPPPCGGQPQISDAQGDGHHNTTDVLSAWFSEAAGRLQAVIRVQAGNWFPDHPPGPARWALLFNVGGQPRYVRAVAPDAPPVSFDYGTWAAPDVFTPGGPTVGALVGGPGGTATIDVPPQTGAVTGAVLSNPFVLTHDADGLIDRAPGGTTAGGTEYGADYVVGSCGGGTGGAPGGAPPGAPGGGGGTGGVSSVQLRAPAKRVGAGLVRVRGSVAPTQAGLPVELTVTGRRAVVQRLTTGADGTFSTSVRLSQTSRIRATAGGLRSEVRTVTMFSKTRITVRRLRGGGTLVRGRVNPALPGRVLFLRKSAVRPTARTSARRGRFRFSFKSLRPGRYQAVFIPSRGRAERSTSKQGVVR